MTTCIKQAISQGVSCWEGPLESPGLALAARICGTDQDVQHLEMQLAQRRLVDGIRMSLLYHKCTICSCSAGGHNVFFFWTRRQIDPETQ